MRYALSVLLALVIALCLGGWSAHWALERSGDIGTVGVGPWIANPFAGAPDADPYSKARVAQQGNLTLGIGEGIRFIADHDSTGSELLRQCEYRLVGQTPPARVWTIAPYTPAGRLVQPGAGRDGWLVSSSLMRSPKNTFEIAVGPSPRSGNWLATTGRGPLFLGLALYDTPAAASTGAENLPLPLIERESCS